MTDFHSMCTTATVAKALGRSEPQVRLIARKMRAQNIGVGQKVGSTVWLFTKKDVEKIAAFMAANPPNGKAAAKLRKKVLEKVA